MNASSYDSIREARYFCERGGPTLDGSTPISHEPTLTHNDYMYAIKNKDGFILTEMGTYDSSPKIHDIKWCRHFLEAEESTVGTSNTVIGAVPLMESLMLTKDLQLIDLSNKLAELYREHVKLKEAHQFIEEMYLTKKKQYEAMKKELDKAVQANNRSTN